MNFQVITLDKDPMLIEEVARLHRQGWPAFMRNDEIANRYWNDVMNNFSKFQILLLDDKKKAIAVGNSIPLQWDGTIDGLPNGWDEAIIFGMKTLVPTTLSALAIVVDKEHQNKGISSKVLLEMKKIAIGNGLKFIAPVRPSKKSNYPLIPLERYVEWKDDKGYPFDPWLRVHFKIGGNVLAIASKSMIIKGTIREWEIWTNMKFLESGTYIIPEALVPVVMDCEKDIGIYEEPNVWIYHEIKT